MNRWLKYLTLTGGLLVVLYWWRWAEGRVITSKKLKYAAAVLEFRVREVPLDRFPLYMIGSGAPCGYTCEVLNGHVVLSSCTFVWESRRIEEATVESADEWRVVFLFDNDFRVKGEFSWWEGSTWTFVP